MTETIEKTASQAAWERGWNLIMDAFWHAMRDPDITERQKGLYLKGLLGAADVVWPQDDAAE